ncbi:aminotransferase class I/II-fold pyridoxal phosphate-dependent enzyme [Phorcysia thermohydrogeniphila]|uniref:8-amino-7-oxononanoate synthase n=1 Tax=Phorcysia thermohydrogeniphila TaxID=936138 RepID=A0A4R1GHD9_9BACT|nr:8-amino-7-oxononanoate synthase [Phorcysia thermohydrogeniphila]TCK06451.1 8-amino-7-oxononanoate synthase [Phorcysia thermohydrogeniphila]
MDWIREELESLRERHLFRVLRTLSTPQGKEVVINGKRLINFSSNDYLALAKNYSPECLREWGAGSGASRLVCGNFAVHEELEEKLAKLKKTESSLLFSSGYMANVGVISTLVKEGDLILSDELNHASIIDGCRLSKATVKVYPHKDLETLEFILSKERKNYRRCLIVTDSVFSMDGDIAPLEGLFRLKNEYEAVLLIDDAHATGVVGWSSLELFNLTPDESTVIIGTLGKALGTFGAFVCGTKLLKDYLINRCRTFIFTTALPPAIACQTLKNLKLVPERMRALREKIDFFRKLTGIDSQSAIFPFITGSEERALKLSEYLLREGYLVPAIRPPTVKESRLRITINYEHTEEELKRLWELVSSFSEKP